MPDGSAPLFISLIILTFFSAFFSCTETAYSCVSRIKLKSLFSGGNKLAGKVLLLAEKKYDKLISTILIGNNIVNLSASSVAGILFAKLLVNSDLNPSVVSTVFITIVVLIFGEITPKLIAKSCAEKITMIVYPIITFFIVVFYPLNLIFSGWQWLLTKIFRFKNAEVITEEEIITMVEEAQEDGTLKQDETKLIRSVIEFDDLEVSDILVPRVNVVAADKKSSMDELREKFESSGFSRLPIYENEIDSIVGTIHEKDFYRLYSNGEKSIEKIIQPSVFVTSHTKISKLLKQMQIEKVHMVIVLDEYGGTFGIITMEDILEELVGEIYDEHDEQVDYIKQTSENSYIVQGETPISKLVKYFNLDEDDDAESNTVNGWLIEKIGDFPEKGQKFVYKFLEFEIKELDEKVIQVVNVNKLNNIEEQEE